MNRKEAKELLPIIQAFAEGKTVQYQDEHDTWINCTDDSALLDINIQPWRYRIKPESKYRPFRTQEECWNEMHKHPDFGWLKGFVTGEYKQLVRIYKCGILSFNMSCNDSVDYSPEIMLRSYLFTDGTPFGIKEE